MTPEEIKVREEDRPVIVHCIGLLVQHATHCDEEDAVHAAWNVWDYLGRPTTAGNPSRDLCCCEIPGGTAACQKLYDCPLLVGQAMFEDTAREHWHEFCAKLLERG
jgi:hypothetical protein